MEAQQKRDIAAYQAMLGDKTQRIGKLERDNSRLLDAVNKYKLASDAATTSPSSSSKNTRPSPENRSRPNRIPDIGFIDADEGDEGAAHSRYNHRAAKQYPASPHNAWGHKPFDRELSAASLSSASSSV